VPDVHESALIKTSRFHVENEECDNSETDVEGSKTSNDGDGPEDAPAIPKSSLTVPKKRKRKSAESECPMHALYTVYALILGQSQGCKISHVHFICLLCK
jgi:hypothetical protein